jgi:hypothetical protein
LRHNQVYIHHEYECLRRATQETQLLQYDLPLRPSEAQYHWCEHLRRATQETQPFLDDHFPQQRKVHYHHQREYLHPVIRDTEPH